MSASGHVDDDGPGAVKKNNRRKTKKEGDTITVLLLGDEGVGKSTLISTFVSRHFSEVVPGIMTRVRLPPDPSLASCVTTIVDSQGGDAALMSAVAAMSMTSPSSGSLSSLSRMGSMSRLDAGGSLGGGSGGGSGGGGGGASTSAGESTQRMLASSSMGGSGISAATPVGMDNIDSIILVYDLDRVETFYRLENHWLPLIERCFDGELPVIIAGNKMDLFRQSSSAASAADDQSFARSRQQIVSLLQRFKFVRQCIKCSAKNLLNVDEVFLKAQQAVLYPITPLYDLTEGRITPNCRRAFTRIFRMFDRDNDGLLSNTELNAFQNRAFNVPLRERDLAGWKKVVSKNNPMEEAVVRDGKFTVSGFLAIFDVFIGQNRLEVPWRILRTFGYDDDLDLQIPTSVLLPSFRGDSMLPEQWRLSESARKFLTAIFHQFDSDGDGILSSEDILSVFAVIPEPSLPPWHSVRAPDVFHGYFSCPKSDHGVDMTRSISPQPTATTDVVLPSSPSPSLSASGITICSATTLPSVDVSASIGSSSIYVRSPPRPLSFFAWMGHWHMISAISPSTTRAELYRLGHIEDKQDSAKKPASGRKRGSKKKVAPAADYSSLLLPSKEIRVIILGSKGCGKTALLNALCAAGEGEDSGTEMNHLKTIPTVNPETSCSYVRLRRRNGIAKGGKPQNAVEGSGEEFISHLILTEVPVAEGSAGSHLTADLSEMISPKNTNKMKSFDLVVFAFDCSDHSSLSFAKEMEKALLTDNVPRVFVGTKVDTIAETTGEFREQTEDTPSVTDEAAQHCAELDLEPPILTSASKAIAGRGDTSPGHRETLEHIARCAFEEDSESRLRSTPHAEKKRREAARRKKMLWFGGLVSVSVAVAIGVGVFLGRKDGAKNRLGWLKSFFVGTSSSDSATPSS